MKAVYNNRTSIVRVRIVFMNHDSGAGNGCLFFNIFARFYNKIS